VTRHSICCPRDAARSCRSALSSGGAWLEVGKPGASPNLGGIDIDTYCSSLAKAAAAQDYDRISPAFRSVTPVMITEAPDVGV
jgi:glycerophosphoryl diester phosphodiesterase